MQILLLILFFTHILCLGDNSISLNLGQKLKDQVKLTQELDTQLFNKMNELNNENEELVAESEQTVIDEVPVRIREILDKLDTEGVLLLSLSEILQLKSHLNQQKSIESLNSQQNKNEDDTNSLSIKLINSAFENEKNHLLEEIFHLREMLSKLTVSPNEYFLTFI